MLLFADAGTLPVDGIYRATKGRSGLGQRRRGTWRRPLAPPPSLELPEPTVVPLERFAEGLALFREGAVLKVVLVP